MVAALREPEKGAARSRNPGGNANASLAQLVEHVTLNH